LEVVETDVGGQRFYTIPEVARILRVSDQSVRRWIKAGELPATKPGKEYRIEHANLEEFLRAREPRPKAPSRSPFELSLFNGLEEERRIFAGGWISAALEGEWGARFEEAKTSLETARTFRDENFAALDAAPRPRALEAEGAPEAAVKAAHRDFGLALLRANAAALLYETMLEGREVRSHQAEQLLQEAARAREDLFTEAIPPSGANEASEAS
jgi:excisionase family DNA binding protein